MSHNKTIPLHEWEMESDDERVNETEKAPGHICVSRIALDGNLFNYDEVIISKPQTIF